MLNVPESMRVLLIKRIVTGSLFDIFLMMSFEFTDFSKATTIAFTNSMFISFFSWIMLGEIISKWDIVGIIGGFIGMLMVMQPFKTSEN